MVSYRSHWSPMVSQTSNGAKFNDMAQMIDLVPPAAQDAEEHARADTQRNKQLFDWADAVLRRLGLDEAIAAARSIQELRRITLDVDSAEVALAIRDALRPASGQRQEHFRGLKERGLELILKNRFADWKKTREATLRRRKQPDWTDQLILDKRRQDHCQSCEPDLILREAPKWKGVLASTSLTYVSDQKRPPWGEEVADTPWTDYHESLVRVWFQSEGINPSAGDVGRAVQTAARHSPFHPVRDLFRFAGLGWGASTGILAGHLFARRRQRIHPRDRGSISDLIGRSHLLAWLQRPTTCSCSKAPQGQLKSEALRALVKDDSWFTDRLSHVGSKDAAMETAGVRLIEIAEMDALTKATSSAIKSFLTRRHDRFRPPYGKHLVNLPRQCVFAGHHQSYRRRLSERPYRCTAILAGCLPRHDRPGWPGNGARSALGRGCASIQGGARLVA